MSKTSMRNRQIELWKLDHNKIKDMTQDQLKKEAAETLSLVFEDDTENEITAADIDVVHRAALFNARHESGFLELFF